MKMAMERAGEWIQATNRVDGPLNFALGPLRIARAFASGAVQSFAPLPGRSGHETVD